MHAKMNQTDSGFSVRQVKCDRKPERVCDISTNRLVRKECMLTGGEVLQSYFGDSEQAGWRQNLL